MTARIRKIVQERAQTLDREGPDPPQVLTVTRLGARQALTPEGFLLCEAVPIARVGEMVYGPGETPVEVGENGLAIVYRDAGDLFNEETIASFMGKSVVDEHPSEDVNPDNWVKLSKGFAFNVRQGEGEEDADVLLADLLVMDSATIKAVQAGKRELSCGYDADYQDLGNGRGFQTNIRGNHIALVERGRCGPRCAIGDHSPQLKGNEDMGTRTTQVVPATKRKIVLAKNVRDAMAEILGEDEDEGEEGNGIHVHVHTGYTRDSEEDPKEKKTEDEDDPMSKRVKAVEDSIAGIKTTVDSIAAALNKTKDSDEEDDPKKTEDEEPEEKKDVTKDSAALATSYQQMLADAEILAPGFKMPTFDAKAKRVATIDTMCNARRSALTTSMSNAEGKSLVEAANGSAVDLVSMQCADVALLFKASVGAKRALNNMNSTRDASRLAELNTNGEKKAPQTLAQVNEANAKFYAALRK